jgi:mono/diheme cytochrome c family protein
LAISALYPAIFSKKIKKEGFIFRRMNDFSKYTMASLLFLFISTAATQSLAGPMMMRHGKGPGMHHHSMGFGGKGTCPQPRWTAPAPEDIDRSKNPLEPTQKNLDAGESLFRVEAQPTACKICHGVVGNGLGMMAQGLNPPPRNFACAETMNDISDGQLFWIIKNGSQGTGMPAYQELKDRQIWQLIHYLRRFPNKGR